MQFYTFDFFSDRKEKRNRTLLGWGIKQNTKKLKSFQKKPERFASMSLLETAKCFSV